MIIKWCNTSFPFFPNTSEDRKKQIVKWNKLSYAIGFPISWGKAVFKAEVEQLHILNVMRGVCARGKKNTWLFKTYLNSKIILKTLKTTCYCTGNILVQQFITLGIFLSFRRQACFLEFIHYKYNPGKMGIQWSVNQNVNIIQCFT